MGKTTDDNAGVKLAILVVGLAGWILLFGWLAFITGFHT